MIKKIDKYWRACNYLTVANMYLKNNQFLTNELQDSDIKDYASGHWGTCPGVNFIYAHLNWYVKRYRRKTQLILGPGHGGNALLANLQLEKSLRKNPVSIKIAEEKMVTKDFCSIRTEVNPFYPGTIYDGGELGYSLAVAFGSVLDKPHSLCVCIIGDGEAETGTLAASWNCKEYMNASSGFVLPIVHLNGYRMGEHSVLSSKSDEDITSIYRGMGYRPFIVEGNHISMYKALERIENTYREIEEGKHNIWPVLILRTPKGWTAPNYCDFHIENNVIAHKNPLRELHSNKTKEYLLYWLKSYQPDELFINGEPCDDILAIIPDKEYQLGNSLINYENENLNIPDAEKYMISPIERMGTYQNICILNNYFSDVIRMNARSFRIFSPDELQSNRLGELTNVLCEEHIENRVIEILNENICQGFMQGYTLTGRSAIMIGYEAFMQIISSMVSQYAKWIFQAEKVSWRSRRASMTYLLTSLCWSNTFSHQNPEFINSILSNEYPFMRIYMPPDANSLLTCTEVCIGSSGKINLIITSKQKMPQWLDPENARLGVKKGVLQWQELPDRGEPDIVIVAAGDYPVRECMEAINAIRSVIPNIKIRFLTVIELTSIGSTVVYPHALEQEEFERLFCNNVPIIFCFHGYPSAIKILLYDRLDSKRLTILGYKNQSVFSCNDLDKMILNGCSRYDIELEVYNQLLKSNKLNLYWFKRKKKEIIGILEERMKQIND